MRWGRKPAGRASPPLGAAVALAVLAGCEQGAPPPLPAGPARALAAIVASCASAAGIVEVRRAGQREYEEVAPGSVFRIGDELRTGPLSTARIELVAGGGLELEETAAVLVDAAPPDPAVAVREGVVRGVLPGAPAGGPAPAMVLSTGDGSEVRMAAQEQRTTFRVSREERGTVLAVITGRATVRGARGEATLAAGQVTVASAGGVGEIAELVDFPASVAPGIDARFQLDPALTIRLAWNSVPGATAYRVQVARDLSFQRSFMGITVHGAEVSFTPKEAGMYAWRVASVDREGRQGEYGAARRFSCEVPSRRLSVRKPARPRVEVPRSLSAWGE
jgi:hypothetical protein